MQFEHIEPDDIERLWPIIAEILAPAVRNDPRQTMEGLHRRLTEGADSLLRITGPGQCLMVIEVDNDLICWTKYLAGLIEGGPKARVSIMRAAVLHLEAWGRLAGCFEHRLCGRQAWGKILPDYAAFDGERNGIMKELQ